MLKKAHKGIVTIQEMTISLIVCKLRALRPRAIPTPKTAPMSAWVVEMGNPNLDASKIVIAAKN